MTHLPALIDQASQIQESRIFGQLDTLDNAITSLSQLDIVIYTIQSKKKYTNADIVALVLVMAEIEKIADVLEQKEQGFTKQLKNCVRMRYP